MLANAYGMAAKDILYTFVHDYESEALAPLVKALTEHKKYTAHILSEIISAVERLLSIDVQIPCADPEDSIGFIFESCDGFGVL